MNRVLARAFPIGIQSIVVIALAVVLFGVVGSLLLFGGLSSSREGIVTPIVGGLAMLGFAFVSFFWWARSCPFVSVSDSQIMLQYFFKRKAIALKDIKTMHLMTKSGMKFWFVVTPMDATVIKTTDDTVFTLWDDFYIGIHRVKLVLEKVQEHIDRGDYNFIKILLEKSSEPVRYPDTAPQIFNTFKGIWFINMWGLMFMTITGAAIYASYKRGGAIAGTFLPLLFFYFFCGYMLHYYELSSDRLIIKNHLWPWMNRTYSFSNIKEIILEAPGKLPNTLKVRTKDFRTKSFPGGSLREKRWKELVRELEVRGILVSDHLHYW